MSMANWEVDEGIKEQYRLLQRQIRHFVKDEIRRGIGSGEYDHLKAVHTHNRHSTELADDTKFRLSILPRPRMITNGGQRNTTFSPLEIFMGVYGTLYNPYNFERGFVCDEVACLRLGVGLNNFLDASTMKSDLEHSLEGIKVGLRYALTDGNYQQFVRMIVPIINASIRKYKDQHSHEMPMQFESKIGV